VLIHINLFKLDNTEHFTFVEANAAQEFLNVALILLEL